jgi:ABC-2 type transport system permease protein
MNLKTFTAMLARDVLVARRNAVQMLVQNLLQPLLIVFVYGRIMTAAGMMPVKYKSLLLPGIIAVSMIMSGIQAVMMPLIADFQFTREIEDRLLAPMNVGWVAVEKVVAGMIQALVAGLMVIPAAWLTMGPGLELSLPHPLAFVAVALLVAMLSSAGGLTLGCSVGQTQIGFVFSLVVAPMIFLGCTYYPWNALASFPMFQKMVLVNPLVYASEGLRATLVPQFPHLSLIVVVPVLLAMDVVLLVAGLTRFYKKAVM